MSKGCGISSGNSKELKNKKTKRFSWYLLWAGPVFSMTDAEKVFDETRFPALNKPPNPEGQEMGHKASAGKDLV